MAASQMLLESLRRLRPGARADLRAELAHSDRHARILRAARLHDDALEISRQPFDPFRFVVYREYGVDASTCVKAREKLRLHRLRAGGE